MRISDLSTFDSKPILLSQFSDLLQANNVTLLGNKSNVPSGLVILDNKGKIPEDADIQHVFYIDGDFPTTGLVKNSLYVNSTGEARTTNDNAEYVNISLQVITNLEDASDETVATSKSIKTYVDAAVAGAATGASGALSAYATKTYVDEAISNIPDPQHIFYVIDLPTKSEALKDSIYILTESKMSYIFDGNDFHLFSLKPVVDFVDEVNNITVPTTLAVSSFVTKQISDIPAVDLSIYQPISGMSDYVKKTDIHDNVVYVDEFPVSGTLNTIYVNNDGQSKIWNGTEFISMSYEMVDEFTSDTPSSTEIVPSVKAVIDYVSGITPTLPDNITTQGNEFNAGNQLVQLVNGKIPNNLYDGDIQHIFYIDEFPASGVANSLYIKKSSKETKFYTGTEFVSISLEITNDLTDSSASTLPTSKSVVDYVSAYYTSKTYVDTELNKKANATDVKDHIFYVDSLPVKSSAITNSIYVLSNSHAAYLFDGTIFNQFSYETVSSIINVSDTTVATTKAISSFVDNKLANIDLPDNMVLIENVSSFPSTGSNNTLYIDNNDIFKIYTDNTWKNISVNVVEDFTTVSNDTVPTSEAVKNYVDKSAIETVSGFTTVSDATVPTSKAVKTYVDSKVIPYTKQQVATTGANIIFNENVSIYTYTVSSATTFTFALDALQSAACYTFELWLNMKTVSTLSFPSNIAWLDGSAPIMDEATTYCIVVRKLPSSLVTNGKNILLNLAYKASL